MFCPKCGNNLNENDDLCPRCGENIKLIRNQQAQLVQENQSQVNNNVGSESTVAETLSTECKTFSSKIKLFIIKYKRQEIIGLIILGLISILVLFYYVFFGYDILKWNETYEDYLLESVNQDHIKLGISFSNRDKIKDIKYTVTCGSVKQTGLVFDWDLSDSLGKCKITIKYKFKRLKKKIIVISNDYGEGELSFDYEIDNDSDEDLDLDGLTNKQEKEYNTDPELSDSDMDGLDDKYELFTSKTDPNKKDSDGDGLSDYDEIELGLNPLKSDSKGDGINDSDRKVTYSLDNDDLGVSLSITGNGNIASTAINTFKNSSFTDMDGLLDTVYNFYTEGVISEASVKIKYSLEEIQNQGLNEDNLTLYYFNDETKELEKIQTTVDKENKVLIANLNHFSKYIIGDSSLVLTNIKSDILFIIDNSVSMYSESQMVDAGYSNSVGAIGNDTSFKRLTLTNTMINMFTGNYRFAVSEFSGNYVKLNDFTSSTDIAKKSVDSMKSKWNTVPNGTNIINALDSGIDEYSVDNDKHYIILLTDGRNNVGDLLTSKTNIISKAKNKNVKICIIGLGSNIDTDVLNDIAESTGCDYYNANNSSALDEIYSIVGADINYNQVDVDGDGKSDGTIIADSGFIVTRDGFSFPNYATNLSTGGHCFGMALFAQLYYVKKLPLKSDGKTVGKLTSYSYDLTDSYFSNYSNLYGYSIKTNVLKYTFGFKYFNEEKPDDLWVFEDSAFKVNSKYKEELVNSGLYDFTVIKSKLTKKQQLEKYGVTYSYTDDFNLSEDKMQNSINIDSTEKNLLNAIYANYIMQDAMTYYSSSTDLLLFVRKVLGVESTTKINSAGFVELLVNRLSSGDAPVIYSQFNGGLHAINAISLIQDNEDANHYYIGVYDNNYPGEKRYVDLKCTKKTCTTLSNGYYSNSNKSIRITSSQDYDLSFFQ